jgi:probable HAF family extracellular repeat protein
MNSRVIGALLGALSSSVAAVAVAAPQYAAIDLGAASVAGAGLAWTIRWPPPPAPVGWPSLGGADCPLVPNSNWLGAQFGSIAVGATCTAQSFDRLAAKWDLSTPITLTVLGVLPGSSAGIEGRDADALDFNTLGDIVGYSTSAYATYYQPSHTVATHGFIYNNGNWTELLPIAGVNYDSRAEGVNDSREVVGETDTISSATGRVLQRAFLYSDGTMYNLTFYLVGGPTVLLSDAYGIDCQGNIAAVGTPASGGSAHNYLLLRQGAARTNCPL